MFFLFISPHLDDAVLSCGGLISKLASSSHEVHVVTVFCGDPRTQKFSDIAREFHYDCNLSGSDIIQVRRNEDVQASKELGFNITHLSFLDCIYRKPNGKFIYNEHERVFSNIIYDDASFLNKINSSLSLFDLKKYDLVFIPLGVGKHVDHVITRQIMENIAFPKDLSSKLRFYEDSPYCFNIERAHSRHTNLVSYLEEISVKQLYAKISGITSYKSQFQMFWYNQQEALNNLKAYSNKISNLPDKYYERYWRKKR